MCSVLEELCIPSAVLPVDRNLAEHEATALFRSVARHTLVPCHIILLSSLPLPSSFLFLFSLSIPPACQWSCMRAISTARSASGSTIRRIAQWSRETVSNACTHTHTHMHARTHARTHACTHTHARTHTHMHAHTHTHTHTHTATTLCWSERQFHRTPSQYQINHT